MDVKIKDKNTFEEYMKFMSTPDGYNSILNIITLECQLMGACVGYKAPIWDDQGVPYICMMSISLKHPELGPKISIVDDKTGADVHRYSMVNGMWHEIEFIQNFGWNWMDILPERFKSVIDRDLINKTFDQFLAEKDTFIYLEKSDLTH